MSPIRLFCTFGVALVLNGVSLRAHAAASFESCAQQVAAQPAAYESYRCYYEVASASGEWEIAGQHLNALATAHPDIDWIIFVRGLVTWPSDRNAAERSYLQAAERFAAAGNVRGEVLARANLQTLLYESGRAASAAREVERVTALAEHTSDPELRIRARVVESQFFISTGTNLGRAYRALKQAEADLDAMPTYWLRHHVLHGLGRVLLLTGRYDESVTYFRRLHDEASAQQDLTTMAQARIDIVNALLEKQSAEPHSVEPQQLFADASEALAAAKRAQDIDIELNALRLLGEVLMMGDAGQARGFLDICVRQAKTHQRSQAMSQCLWIQARLLADTNPIAAQRAIDEAIELLQHAEGIDHQLLAYAWRHAMRIAWQTQSQDKAISTGKQALTAIERLRDLQPELQSRAAAFSAWTQDYYWLSGQVLRAAVDSRSQTALLDEAFQIGERMRARSLLDRLRAPPRPPSDMDGAALKRREAVLKDIVDVNRKLLKAEGAQSTKLLRELEALERQEVDAREPQLHSHNTMRPVSIAEIQKTLRPDEVLLSFQIGLAHAPADRFAGGAWLFAITRARAQVFELPDRHELAQSLAVYKGLMSQPSGHRARASLALYDQLLRAAIASLPSGIEHLIVVPDSPLDTFPLATLSNSLVFDPLANHYRISLVPSATIWHGWRSTALAPDQRAALVLADPTLEFATDKASPWRSAFEEAGFQPGRLPHAREEGFEIVQRLRRQGTLWTGADASEAALKASDLSQYGVLHFATHAVVNSANSDRSAILLASGTHLQDGLLQSREIAELRLNGHLVVLSSCQSAMGTQIRGEGVMGLARSFFAAGARVVIGSLWPIRDDHAQAFFEPFYATLAEGRTVGAAFHEAQRHLIDAGFPMEAWAGFVLMGDADIAPVPPVTPAHTNPAIAAVIAMLILGGGLAAALYVKKYRRQATQPL